MTTYIWSSLSGIWPVPRADASLTTAGGQTSVMPCSRVWMSRKKSMRARWRAAPGALVEGEARSPRSWRRRPGRSCPAARRPPSAACAPRRRTPSCCSSRWGSGSPQVRTMTLASGPPTGMPGSGGLGMRRSSSSSRAVTSARRASRPLISAPIQVDCSRSRVTSGPLDAAPPLMAAPIELGEGLALVAQRVGLALQVAALGSPRARASSTRAGSSPLRMQPRRMSVGLLAQSRHPDAHAAPPSAVPAAGPVPKLAPATCAAPAAAAAARRRSATKPGSRLASSQPARGPLARPRKTA